MLTAAPRTRAQLYSALSRRGVPDETAEAVLGRFAEVGLIDDAMFAASWVESRHHGRGLSARALAAELRQRGVAADNIPARPWSRKGSTRLGPESTFLMRLNPIRMRTSPAADEARVTV